MTTPTHDIELTDCMDYLRSVPDNSVDLVITDPPYFIGFDGGRGWDSQWKSEAEYLAWCDEWTRELVRVLKPDRMLIVWGTLKTDTFLRYKLDSLSAHPDLVGQNEIIWSYNWGGRSTKNFARKHEYAWCYSKGHDFLFNGDEVRVARKVTNNIRTGEAHKKGTIPTLVWEHNNHTMSQDFIGWHPTTKNLTVMMRLINAYSNPGDTVLDIFMGSGSTAIAALRTGRSVIGCETDEDYLAKTNERIKQEEYIKAA